MTTPMVGSYTEWFCPNCGATDTTTEARPHARYHTCPKLRYLSAPMVKKGTRARVYLRERDDYVGDELVQLDPELGRPVMSIVTERDEGQDVVVFAPTAVARMG